LDVAREAALQRKFVIQKRLDQQILLYRVMYQLSTGAVDLCGDRVSGATGMVTVSAKMFPGEYRAVAQSEYGFDDGLTVAAVVPRSPAQMAGLEPGDHIFSINGTAVAAAPDDAKTLRAMFRNSADAQAPVSMVIRRGGSNHTLAITPLRACDYPAIPIDDTEINAFADGNQVFVTTAMLNFIRSDQELAVVISHEMSHNILGHIDKERQNEVVGTLAGLALDIAVAATTGVNTQFYRTGDALGKMAFSVQFEQEADYEGFYVMRHAGYALDGAANFWRRFAAELPASITVRTTHPTSPERFLALESAMNEINLKEMRNVALLPNLQPGKSGQTTTQFAAAPAINTGQQTALGSPPPTIRTSVVPSENSVNARQTVATPAKPGLGIIGGTLEAYDNGPTTLVTDPHGAWVDGVVVGSPAGIAGIKPGDIVRSSDGYRVNSFDQLNEYAARSTPGSTVRLSVWRGQQLIVIPVKLKAGE
jgi:S1-C subfamily serine protease